MATTPVSEKHEIDSALLRPRDLSITETNDGIIAERAFTLRASVDNFAGQVPNFAAYSRAIVASAEEDEDAAEKARPRRKTLAPSCRSRLSQETVEVRYEVPREKRLTGS